MSTVLAVASATFTSQLGGTVELTQYNDGTCAIRATDADSTQAFVVLTNPLARCIASTLSEMAGD